MKPYYFERTMAKNKKKKDEYIRIKERNGEADDRGVYANSFTLRKLEETPSERIKKIIPKHIWQGIENAYKSRNLPEYMAMGKEEYALLKEEEAKKKKERENQEAQSQKSEESDNTSVIQDKISIIKNIRSRKIEEIIGEAAASIALSTEANVIVSVEKSDKTDDDGLFVKVSVFKKKGNNKFDRIEYHTRLKRAMPGSVLPLRDILSESIAKKYIEKNDRVVCVEDESVSMGFKGMLFIFDVDDLFFNISTAKLPEMVNSEILEAVINLSQEMAIEGREGSHLGTTFIIGVPDDIMEHTRQIIINPFRNYPEEERKITDPTLKETVKSFAQLDGAFIVDEKGTIITAGAMISNHIPGVDPVVLPGFGTRHNSAATLTKAVDCVAVIVSSSGGAIRIFKEGKMLMRVR